MNTAKTTLIKEIIIKHKFKRILWITFRQSYTNNMAKLFENLNFTNYMNVKEKDKLNEYNRLFCQVESLFHLIKYDRCMELYDLIVLDEVESILNQFNSDKTLGDQKEQFFELFCNICKDNQNKIIAVDADYSDRSHTFIKSLGRYILLNNTYQGIKRNFNLTNNITLFLSKIEKDLKNKKNICIIGMSTKILYDLYNKYKDKYKSILHCKDSDDSLKEQLKEVETLWSKYQLVLYSPTIEAGIDMNKKHFDRIYGILCSNTNSQRSFFQMTGRIRQVKDKNIMCYFDISQITPKTYAQYYVYDDCYKYYQYISELANFRKRYFYNHHKLYYGINIELYETIMIYNDIEQRNKSKNYFIPVFKKICVDKDFGFNFIDEQLINKTKKSKKIKEIKKEQLIEVSYIDNEMAEIIQSKINNNIATEYEKIQMIKYKILNTFGIDKLDEDFIDTYYKKNYLIYNFMALLDEKNIIGDINDKTITERHQKVKIIKEILYDFGMNDITQKITISRPLLLEIMDNIIENNKIFTDEQYIRQLFGLEKSRRKKITSKEFLKYINQLLNLYGIDITKKNSFKKKNSKSVRVDYYMILIDLNIVELIKYKHKRNSNIYGMFKLEDVKTNNKFTHLINDQL